MTSTPAAPPSALPGAPAGKFDRSDGYMLSSLDLNAGLEVRVVAPRLVPGDIWLELLRLQAAWPTAPQGSDAAA